MSQIHRSFDAVFHLSFLGVALTNVWLLSVRSQRTELLDDARAETWWSLLLPRPDTHAPPTPRK